VDKCIGMEAYEKQQNCVKLTIVVYTMYRIEIRQYELVQWPAGAVVVPWGDSFTCRPMVPHRMRPWLLMYAASPGYVFTGVTARTTIRHVNSSSQFAYET
jgi:hypothetical protein